MTRLIAVSAACALLVYASSAVAQEEPEPTYEEWWIAGLGLNDCGKYLSEINLPGNQGVLNEAGYHSWITGYISGESMGRIRAGKRTLDQGASNDAIFLATQNYCEENPLHRLFVAAANVWLQLLENEGIEP